MLLRKYLLLVIRWKWLLILGLVFGMAGGYSGSLLATPIYQANTKVMVAQSGQNQPSDITAYLNSQQLTETYVQLLKTELVMETVYERLGLTVDPGHLGDGITAKSIANTQLIQITVEDSDPKKAQLIANAFVAVLLEQNDSIQSSRYSFMEESLQVQKLQMEMQITELQNQIDTLSTKTLAEQKKVMEDQITTLQTEISNLEKDIATTTPTPSGQNSTLDDKISRLAQLRSLLSLYQQNYNTLVVTGQLPVETNSSVDSQLSLMRTTLTLYQQIYVSILNNLETTRLARMQNTPNVVQIEAATLPVKPVRPRVFLNTALAGVIGLFVAVVWIFIKEYVDDTLKTPEDIEKLLGLPVLGSIAKLNFENGAEILYVRKHPRSIISEAFRTLRTNLEFIHPLKTVLVTSPGPEEGKSTIAANLAEIISQVNKQVILLDADMRKPKVHQILGIPNRIGLSDVFRTHHWENQDVLRPVGDSKYLRVITSGNIPPNPADLLGSELMLKFLEELKKLSDVVVIDSPPSLVSDSQILSTRVDGVIVVIKPGFTRINAAKTTVEQMKRSGAKLIGVVINGIPKEYSYYYGGSYYSSDQEKMYDGYVEEGEVGNKK